MFAPPHDGFYSTVISGHVKYHRAPANNLKHISFWSPAKLEQLMIDCVIDADIDREEEISWEFCPKCLYCNTALKANFRCFVIKRSCGKTQILTPNLWFYCFPCKFKLKGQLDNYGFNYILPSDSDLIRCRSRLLGQHWTHHATFLCGKLPKRGNSNVWMVFIKRPPYLY